MNKVYLDESINKSKLSQRNIRTLVFYLIYAMETFNYDVDFKSLAEKICKGFDIQVDLDKKILNKAADIIKQRDAIDKEMEPLLTNWSLSRLGCITKLILRLAIWELKNTDLAPSIVINEAIELAKCFGEHDSYKFVNGILDKWLIKYQPDRAKKEE